MTWFASFISFARLHTIIGTSLSVIGLYAIAAAHAATGQMPLGVLALTLVSCLAANVYIVGLNQLTDVDIDRINKPYLPLAAGQFSMRTGWVLVLSCLLLALLIALSQGRYLTITVLVSLLIGTAYSLPPVRLKRFHFWAAACIFTVRGVVVNVFLFLHFNMLLSGSERIPPHVWVLTAFILGLSLVIAWFKDLADMEGDRLYKIITLPLRLGPQKVFNAGRGLLAACYLGLIAAGLTGLSGVQPLVLSLSHALLLAVMWVVSIPVQPAQKASIARYYLFVWVLFFAEYIFFATACILA